MDFSKIFNKAHTEREDIPEETFSLERASEGASAPSLRDFIFGPEVFNGHEVEYMIFLEDKTDADFQFSIYGDKAEWYSGDMKIFYEILDRKIEYTNLYRSSGSKIGFTITLQK